MNARLLITATFFTAFAGVLGADAADSQLLSLVMPDAKVLAGVNVDQAKASPFGQSVLSQIEANNTGLQQLIALTGFDPTRDVHEVLAASNATPGGQTGLALARGNFDIAKITAAATAGGGTTESYKGVTIIEDPKQTNGVAFLDSTLAIAGDLASVKAAIDRPGTGKSLPATVINQVNQWSAAQDAWVITTVPLSSLTPPAGTPPQSGFGAGMQNMFQQIQSFGAGVKFGNNVVVTAQAQADNAQDATQMANALQLLVNVAQAQAGQNNPDLSSVLQGLSITTQGSAIKVSLSVPQSQIQQLMTQHKDAAESPARRPMVRK
ncbi:MAG TPA: hypothetical protein VLY04_01350 [Bryobacteraceae bacterium]|nr:hypothetical protein [Bryobacteraceae bacterium]